MLSHIVNIFLTFYVIIYSIAVSGMNKKSWRS